MNDKDLTHEEYLAKWNDQEAAMRIAARRTDPEARQLFRQLYKQREELQERYWKQTRTPNPWLDGAL